MFSAFVFSLVFFRIPYWIPLMCTHDKYKIYTKSFGLHFDHLFGVGFIAMCVFVVCMYFSFATFMCNSVWWMFLYTWQDVLLVEIMYILITLCLWDHSEYVYTCVLHHWKFDMNIHSLGVDYYRIVLQYCLRDMWFHLVTIFQNTYILKKKMLNLKYIHIFESTNFMVRIVVIFLILFFFL